MSESRSVSVVGADATGVTVTFANPSPEVDVTATISGDEIVVTLTTVRKAASGDYSGDLHVTAADGRTYLIPWFVRLG